MRVLLVVAWDTKGGHNSRAENLKRLFAAAGHETVLLYRITHESQRLSDLIRNSWNFRAAVSRHGNATSIALDPFFNYAPGIRHNADMETPGGRSFSVSNVLIRLLSPLGFVRDVSCWLSFWAYIVFRSPGTFDWCLGFDAGGAVAAWLLKHTRKVRLFVYEDQDYGPMGSRLRQKVTAWLEKSLLRRADLVISVGHRLSALRRTQTTRPCHVVPNGAQFQMFEAGQEKLPGPPTLVFAGNIHAWDGLDLAIEALPEIARRAGPVRLLIVGSGPAPLIERLHGLVRQKGLSDVVHFLGPRAHHELPAVFRQGHIGLAHFEVVPFRVFSFPLKVIEYMAAGMPVIATDNTEAGDVVSRAQCGRSIPFSSAALAGAVADLLLNPLEYEKQRRNAIERSKTFDWDRLFKQEYEIIAAQVAAAKPTTL